jgi:hypothetical protein
MGLLSTMAMSVLLRRLDATITVHGFRSLFRCWAAETGVEFSVAEQCLAHAIGSNVTRSYLRTSMLELRRPVLACCGGRDENLSAVIVRLFDEQANEQIAELLRSEQGPSNEGS